MTTAATRTHVHDLWDDTLAASEDALGRLVHRSNALGSDQRITNTGGGNTSSKATEIDPLTGEPVEVLWVKGSGGDLRTSGRGNFSSLYMDKLNGLKRVYAEAADAGLKSPAEDGMVAMYKHCTFNLNPRASSIDTPLHAFVPARHVDHMHPNAVIALAASKDGERVMREIYGDELFWLPWMRPGFELGLELERGCRENPNARGAIMGQHGLINWADDDRECYELTLDLIERSAKYIEDRDKAAHTFGGQKHAALAPADRRDTLLAVLPHLRGRVSVQRRMIATVQDDPATLRFVCSNDAGRLAELGTSCPDHFLRTKIKPLLVDWDPASRDIEALLRAIDTGIERYVADYAAYYDACKRPGSPAMRQPSPTVILIPGIGMIAFGKNKSESRVTAEFYTCAIEVMRGAEAIGGYIALPQQEAFDIEYWALEEAKLQRMPKDKPLAGHVAMVVGAGSGIGRETAHRLVPEDAHIACVDLHKDAAAETADELLTITGPGIGVAGSGVSSCGPAIGLACDMTDRAAVRAALDDIVLAYGGIDDLIITAGMFASPGPDGTVPDEMWQKTFAVNVIGPAVAADEAAKIMHTQSAANRDLDGTMVITTSVNAVVAKKGSIAYDTSKTAANHLIRELAVTHAPHVRVNGVAPATVIEGSTMFPRERVIASLAKYNIEFEKSEATESLIEKLGRFYASRTLLKKSIRPKDQAEAIFQLVSPNLSRTTGQVIHVDAGLADAFLR